MRAEQFGGGKNNNNKKKKTQIKTDDHNVSSVSLQCSEPAVRLQRAIRDAKKEK